MSIKSLVTGGLGFIGSHLVEELLRNGDDVTVIDNSVTGRRASLDSVSDHPRLSVIEADATVFESILPHFKGIERVFHLAALASIVPSIERPIEYYHANVTGTVNTLEAARDAGVRRFIYAASSSCYGIPDEFPTNEAAAIKPMYPYALTKYLAELAVLHWSVVYGISAVALRLFNVYGPRASTSNAYGAVFGVFLAQRLAQQPLTIVGDGTQTRDFTYVTDVARAFVKAAESDVSNDFLNVGSGGTYSVNQLADLIGGPRIHAPERPGEPACTYADISKILKIVDWEPQVSFEEGVQLTLDQIDHWKDAPVWTLDTIAESTRAWFRYLSPKRAQQ